MAGPLFAAGAKLGMEGVKGRRERKQAMREADAANANLTKTVAQQLRDYRAAYQQNPSDHNRQWLTHLEQQDAELAAYRDARRGQKRRTAIKRTAALAVAGAVVAGGAYVGEKGLHGLEALLHLAPHTQTTVKETARTALSSVHEVDKTIFLSGTGSGTVAFDATNKVCVGFCVPLATHRDGTKMTGTLNIMDRNPGAVTFRGIDVAGKQAVEAIINPHDLQVEVADPKYVPFGGRDSVVANIINVAFSQNAVQRNDTDQDLAKQQFKAICAPTMQPDMAHAESLTVRDDLRAAASGIALANPAAARELRELASPQSTIYIAYGTPIGLNGRGGFNNIPQSQVHLPLPPKLEAHAGKVSVPSIGVDGEIDFKPDIAGSCQLSKLATKQLNQDKNSGGYDVVPVNGPYR